MKKPQKGDVITDLEGYDFGDEGAVVVKVRGDDVDLVRVDNNETFTVSLDELEFSAEDHEPSPEIESSWYDKQTYEQGPKVEDIRTLPDYWLPRDPNMPSTMTDVTWRPENRYRRWQQRYYSVEERSIPNQRRILYRIIQRPIRYRIAKLGGISLRGTCKGTR